MKINRPKIEDYTYCNSIIDDEKCEKDLEKYCDKLERALDTSCEMFKDFEACTNPSMSLVDNCTYDCKQCWKEYLLKNE